MAPSWWRYHASECRGVWWDVPTGASEGRCGVGVRWRAIVEDTTRLRVEEYGKKYLIELSRAAVSCECVGPQLVEI